MDRDLYELLNKRQRPEGIPHERIHVDGAALGYVRDVELLSEAETGIGADVTIYGFPSRLDGVYGGSPVSVHLFGRIRFGAHMGMGGHDHDAGHAHAHSR